MEIAYCPERFNPGDPNHGVRCHGSELWGVRAEKVGNGLVSLYQQLTTEDVRYVGKIEVAEAAKVIENVQRDINITLVNELARIFPELRSMLRMFCPQRQQNGIFIDTRPELMLEATAFLLIPIT